MKTQARSGATGPYRGVFAGAHFAADRSVAPRGLHREVRLLPLAGEPASAPLEPQKELQQASLRPYRCVVQLGSFRSPEAARRHLEGIRARWRGRLHVVARPEAGLYALWTDTLSSEPALQERLQTLRAQGIEGLGIRLAQPSARQGFSVASGAFRTLKPARALAERLARALRTVCVVDFRPTSGFYVVLTVPLSSRQEAEQLLARVRLSGEVPNAYLVPVSLDAWRPLYRTRS